MKKNGRLPETVIDLATKKGQKLLLKKSHKNVREVRAKSEKQGGKKTGR